MWTGGGVALGPKPRSYKQRTPKKMVRLALLSALSDRAAEGNVLVVDGWGIEAPSTKAAKALLEAIGATGKALVVLRADEVLVAKSFRNLPNVHVLLSSELNAYDVLCSDVVVFTPDTLPTAGANQPVSVASTAPTTPAATEETEA
jgi:large subunit ribosomal protein L4